MEIRRKETIRKGNTVFCIKSVFNGTKSAKEILITAISKDIEETKEFIQCSFILQIKQR